MVLVLSVIYTFSNFIFFISIFMVSVCGLFEIKARTPYRGKKNLFSVYYVPSTVLYILYMRMYMNMKLL